MNRNGSIDLHTDDGNGADPDLRGHWKSCGLSMLTIKPHHFIDIITQFGDEGAPLQPHPFGHAVHTVAQQLLTNRNIMLCMELGSDAICEPCCHNVSGVCDDTIDTSFRPQAPASKQDYNQLIDRRWCERLGLEQGDRLSARAFCARVQDRAGNIEEIYRETPAERTQARQAKLLEGIAWFLGEEPRF